MLRSVDEHSDEIRTDPLQVLHVVYNLDDILSLKPTGVGHTLNDSQLKDQVKSLKCCEVCLFVCKIQWLFMSQIFYRCLTVTDIFQCLPDLHWSADVCSYSRSENCEIITGVRSTRAGNGAGMPTPVGLWLVSKYMCEIQHRDKCLNFESAVVSDSDI